MQSLGHRGACVDVYNQNRRTVCTCLVDLSQVNTAGETGVVVDYLINYCKLDFTGRRSLILEWKKYAASSKFAMEGAAHRQQQHRVYLLPGSATHLVYQGAICLIMGKGRRAWSSIGKKDGAHGLVGFASNNALSAKDYSKLFDYFFVLMKQGAPRATKLVAQLAADGKTVVNELKDADADLVELPACNSKRALYRTFLFENGWDVGFDNQSRQHAEEEKPGATLDRALSWPTFCLFWQKNFPKLVLSQPVEDICDDCVVFANRHKYLKRSRIKDPEDSDYEEGKDDATPMASTVVAPPVPEAEGDADPIPIELENIDENALMLDDRELAEHEDIVIKAAKHVMMARKQRLLFIKKKEDAKRDAIANKKQDERMYTFMADFAQNIYIPNFSAEQPGATYYYSPLNVYPFGVVDGSTDPTELTAHVYYEGEAKKGGNLGGFNDLETVIDEGPTEWSMFF